MTTIEEFRKEVSIPVLETTSAFARGVTLAEAFRLWQAHDHARKEARCYEGGTKAPLNVYAMSMQSNPEAMRYCA